MENYKSRLTSYLIPFLSVLVCTNAFARENDGNGNSSPGAGQRGGVLEAQELRPKERDGDWLVRVRDALEREEYKPSESDDESGRRKLQAPNRAHGFRTYFEGEGVTVVPRDGSRKWDFSFKVTAVESVGEDGHSRNHLRKRGEVEVVEDQVEYNHGELTEWYKNDKRGLEMGFTLAEEFGPCDAVEIQCEISHEVVAALDPTGKSLIFINEKSDKQFQFNGLTAFDSKNNPLPSSFKLNGDGFSIVVDTSRAIFPVTVDPWLMASEWMSTLAQASARIGICVAGAGDVNNDGYDDVLVAADYFDSGQTDEGKVFLYYGSATGLSTTAGWTAESDQASAYFGRSVASAGDVNADGYDDIIVGAPYYDSGQTNEGRVYLYLGSQSGPVSTAIWTSNSNYAESNQTSAYFGSSVASAGDVNCDGKADVIIGAPYYNNGQTDEGRAYVYNGTSTGLSATPWTAESNQTSAYFGTSVAGIGNVNGSECDDIAIGADHYNNGQTDEGKVYVYFGTTTGFNATPWTAESNQAGALFGVSVAGAGNVNGDEYGDVLIGADHYDNGQTNEGRAFLYLGPFSTGLPSSPVWTSEPDVATSGYGFRVSGAGDVNGDGYDDVLIGAQYISNNQTNEGRVYVYYGIPGGVGLPSQPNWKAESNLSSANFGASVARAGDVNGDGYSDIIVGAPAYDSATTGGRAFVYFGSPFGLPWLAENFNTASALGTSVDVAADLDGDGFADVVAGAPGYSGGQTSEGQVLFYKGSESGLTQQQTHYESDQAYASLGTAVAIAGDVNGNGYKDVVVGAPNFDNGQTNEGGVFVFDGQSVFTTPAATVLEIDEDGAGLGRTVAWAGDVNNDGYADIIVGAPDRDYNGGVDNGGAFVFYGSSSGLSSANRTTINPDTTDTIELGRSVSGAGDLNGDGYDDVVVGTYVHGYPGKAYAYYGSSTGINVSQPAILTQGDAPSRFGYMVAAAGDVDDDGYDDLLVTEDKIGKVYLFRGTQDGVSTVPTWTSPRFQGYEIAGAGDVNGDGYGDILVGDSMHSKAYLYLGTAHGLLAEPEWYAQLSESGANFGKSLAGRGDINNDGFDDIVVGAPGADYSGGASNSGKLFVYYGKDIYGQDSDWDGLSDRSEIENYGTSPTSSNTDGDCLSDYDEIFLYGTNPNSSTQDTDGDQLTDADEVCLYNTNRLLLDTDGDGCQDGADAFPLDPDECLDTDHDGTGDEADTDDDNDGCPDLTDAFPLNAAECVDTDNDGIGDNADTDDDGDGCPDLTDAFPQNAAECVDTDNDGIGDNADTDDDGDGCYDPTDDNPLIAPCLDFDNDHIADSLDADDDNDGCPDLTDAFPMNAAECIDTDGDGVGNNADTDDDNDGLSDDYELNTSHTNPLITDTDGDGFNDKVEVSLGDIGTDTSFKARVVFQYDLKGQIVTSSTSIGVK